MIKLVLNHPIIYSIVGVVIFLVAFLLILNLIGGTTVEGSDIIGPENGPNKQLQFRLDKSPLTGICYELVNPKFYPQGGSVVVIDCKLYDSIILSETLNLFKLKWEETCLEDEHFEWREESKDWICKGY